MKTSKQSDLSATSSAVADISSGGDESFIPCTIEEQPKNSTLARGVGPASASVGKASSVDAKGYGGTIVYESDDDDDDSIIEPTPHCSNSNTTNAATVFTPQRQMKKSNGNNQSAIISDFCFTPDVKGSF